MRPIIGMQLPSRGSMGPIFRRSVVTVAISGLTPMAAAVAPQSTDGLINAAVSAGSPRPGKAAPDIVRITAERTEWQHACDGRWDAYHHLSDVSLRVIYAAPRDNVTCGNAT